MDEDQPVPIDNHNPTAEREVSDASLVNSLREQVHKAFLQINEMQKFYLMESQEKEASWRQKQQQYKEKISELEEMIKEKQQYQQYSSFIVDLGDADDSNFLDNIVHVNQSLRDSGIYNLQQILSESEKTPHVDPQQKMKAFKQLEKCVIDEVKQVTPSLQRLFQQCQQLCIEHLRRWEELRNLFDENQVMKSKMQQAYGILTKYRNNQVRLKAENKQLKTEFESLRERYLTQMRSKNVIETNLHRLEQKVEQNQTQYSRLQNILRDQTCQLEQFRNQHSILNENHQINDSRSHINNNSVSNISTLSNFLTRLNKPVKQQKPVDSKPVKNQLKFNHKLVSEPIIPVSSINMFKKKAQAHKNQN